MTIYNLEQLNKEQNVNPGFGTVATQTTQTNPAQNAIPMVSEDAIDTDMSDKIVKTQTVNNTQQPENETKKEEKPGFFKRIRNAVKKTANSIANKAEQLYKRGVIKVAELTDSETVLEYAHSFEELSDENLERLADTDVKSGIQKFRQKAGEVTAKIKDVTLQLETALRHTKDGDDDVRLGYAHNLPDMQAENQAPIAGNIAEYSVSAAPTQEVINQMPNCATEEQANVVNATTKGIAINKNYTEEVKTELGINTARQIINLVETQQAKAYKFAANNMHEYEKVVGEIIHQVANIASDKVRQEAIEKLQNSEYENVKNLFTPENIQKVQKEYKRVLGVEETIPETASEKDILTTETLDENIDNNIIQQAEIETEAINTIVIENQNAETTQIKAQTTNKEITSSNEQCSSESFKYTASTKETSSQNTLRTFKECKSIKDVEEVIKNASREDVKKFYARLNESQKLGLFKNTQSPEIQLSMLKQNIVKYEDVHSNLLPAVNSILAVYTLNHEIDEAIQLA